MAAGDLQIVPLFGRNNKGKSSIVTAERRLNFYAEPYADADKTSRAMFGRFGLTRKAYSNGGPIRGISERVTFTSQTPFIDVVLMAHGNLLEQWSPGSPLVGSAFLRTSSGLVTFASSGVEVIAVDGRTGYVVNLSTGALTVLEDVLGSSFPNLIVNGIGAPINVAFIAGRFVVPDPSVVGRFRWSDVYAGTSWQSLSFATAESSGDPLLSCFAAAGELVLIGRDTTEFWSPVGSTVVFQRISGSGFDYGTEAPASIIAVNGGWAMVGRSRNGGERQVLFVQGHTLQEISTPDVVFDINNSAAPDSATSCAYVIGGHTMLQINLPETTWVFDFKSGEWQEFNTDGGRCSVDRVQAAFGMLVGADYRDGRVYELDVTNVLDDGNSIAGEIVTRHVFNNYNPVTVSELYVEFEVGDGPATASLPPPSFAIVTSTINQRVAIPDAPQLACGQFQTVEFWYQLPVNTGGGYSAGELLSKWNGTTQSCYALTIIPIATTPPTFTLFATVASLSNDPILARFQQCAYPNAQGAWHHIAMVFDGTQPVNANRVALLLDGVPQVVGTSGSFPASLLASTNPVTVGAQNGTVRPFNGGYDEVRIWNTARTAAQIAAYMNVQAVGNEPGLVAVYRFGEGSGNVTADGTNFHNTATLNGSPLPAWINNTGVLFPAPSAQASLTPQAMLSWSKDGGRTWGAELWTSLGAQGQYLQRATWRPLVKAIDIVFKIRVTDPVKRVVTNGAMLVT
jgi:Concanavalin A-like lectin/glucanases superfamily